MRRMLVVCLLLVSVPCMAELPTGAAEWMNGCANELATDIWTLVQQFGVPMLVPLAIFLGIPLLFKLYKSIRQSM